MHAQQSTWSDDDPSLPSPDDPGPRYVAPATGARVAGTSARDVAERAGLALRLNRTAALQLIAYDGYDAERSFFDGVRMVPLRCPLRRDEQGSLEVVPARAPTRLRLGVAQAAEGLRERIQAATSATLADAQRAGVLLSGGLDSSAVAAAASVAWREHGRDRADLRMYHMLPPAGPSEVEHARAVAQHLGHTLVEVRPTDDEASEEALLAALEFPTADAGFSPSLALLRRAGEDGVACFLTGDGGDEAVAAYGTRHEAGSRGILAARAHMVLGGCSATLRRRLRRFAPASLRRRKDPPLPAWLAVQVRGLERPNEMPAARAGLRGVAAARDRSLRATRQALIVSWWRTAGALFGLRADFPLLDTRVTDFAVAVPQWVIAAERGQKSLLRRALVGVLPERQRTRPKDQPYVEPWLRARLREHAAVWTERYLSGGVLETLVQLPRDASAGLLAEAAGAPTAVLHRALAFLGVERWFRAKPCLQAFRGV